MGDSEQKPLSDEEAAKITAHPPHESTKVKTNPSQSNAVL